MYNEMVLGDVNANVTTVLERAKNSLKDNRIPPVGFLTNHAVFVIKKKIIF